MSADFFGTYDIRAIVGPNFNETTYETLGKAFALWLKHKGITGSSPWVAMGYDARLHSPSLYATLTASLQAQGISVLSLGMVPSPIVYFAEHVSQEPEKYTSDSLPCAVASLVVTASHNPAPYNGVKFNFKGLSITRQDLLEIKEFYLQSLDSSPFEKVFPGQGCLKEWDALAAYEQWAVAQFGQFKSRPKVVIDSGNGTAGVIAPRVLAKCDCEIISLFEEPDGNFPNHHPDPCAHKNLVSLIDAVKTHNADLGIAFDGDSDRLGVVDAHGNIIPGDMLLLLYLQDVMRQPESKSLVMVSEVKCSQFLFDEAEKLGAKAIMSPTGHAIIKQRMIEEKALLGGELSGHLFFKDRHWGFDDAVYAALRLISIVDGCKQLSPIDPMGKLTQALPVSYLSEEQRIHMDKSIRQKVLDQLLAFFKEQTSFAEMPIRSIATIDGIRVNFSGGFCLVRLSNTEACLTTRCEAPTAQLLSVLEKNLDSKIHGFLSELTETDAGVCAIGY